MHFRMQLKKQTFLEIGFWSKNGSTYPTFLYASGSQPFSSRGPLRGATSLRGPVYCRGQSFREPWPVLRGSHTLLANLIASVM